MTVENRTDCVYMVELQVMETTDVGPLTPHTVYLYVYKEHDNSTHIIQTMRLYSEPWDFRAMHEIRSTQRN